MNPPPQSPYPPLPDPPGRWIQKINAILHDNDGSRNGNSNNIKNRSGSSTSSSAIVGDGPILSYVFYMCFWCTIFGIIAPLVVFIYLPIQCAVQTIRYLLSTYTTNNSHFTYDLLHPQNSASTNMAAVPLDLGIVITGCDTGFGKELAFYAANELGYTVFAGCLHPQSSWNQNSEHPSINNAVHGPTSNYTKNGKIIPIAMDVTDSKQVSQVVRHVQQWLLHQDDPNGNKEVTVTPSPKPKRVLHALVNNAGVGRGSIFDWSSYDDDLPDHRYCMDVNYFGMIRCCKAFLPIFKEQSIQNIHTGGRIINMTSMAGYISNGVIGMSAYSASKHAANAFSHMLRSELISSYHIQVSTINPSFHKTPLVDTMDDVFNKTWENLDPKLKEEYGEEYFDRVRDLCVHLPQRCKWDMDVVVQQVILCLRRKYIPPEVIVGADAKYVLMMLRMMPYNIIDFFMRFSYPPIPAIMKKAATVK